MTLQELTEAIMDQARAKGFGTTPGEISVAEKIALIHSEVAEAYDAYRRKNLDGPHGFAEELGDVLQRTLHLCGVMGVDAEREILAKLAKNRGRDWDWDALNEESAHREAK